MPKRSTSPNPRGAKKSTKRVRRFREKNKAKKRVELLLSPSEISLIRHAARRWDCSQQAVLKLALIALAPVFSRELSIVQALELFTRTRDQILDPMRPQAPLPNLCRIRPSSRSVAEAQALLRAAGKCDLCKQRAPFRSRSGQPYLEPHSIRYIGPPPAKATDPSGIAALCPNCHKRLHFGENGAKLNASLAQELRPT